MVTLYTVSTIFLFSNKKVFFFCFLFLIGNKLKWAQDRLRTVDWAIQNFHYSTIFELQNQQFYMERYRLYEQTSQLLQNW